MGSSTDIASMATALGLDAGEADSFEVMLAVKALVKERDGLRAQLEELRDAALDILECHEDEPERRPVARLQAALAKVKP